MDKFETLDPKEAKRLEDEAVAKFTPVDKQKPKVEVSSKQKEEPIFKARSVFPFELFPDELLVFKNRLTLVKNLGPGMTQVRHMHLHEIAQVEADCGPIFGHLHVIPKLRTEEPLTIERLWRKKTLEARDFIENLMDKPPEINESTF